MKKFQKKKIIDVSGFMYTGKAAVMDFFREFKNCEVHEKNFEFCLIRIQGGILDLKSALIDNWSPIRSNAAIKRFKEITEVLARGKTRIFKPTDWFKPTGQDYENIFGNNFYKLTDLFFNELINYQNKMYWPYPDFESKPFRSFFVKFLNLFKLKYINSVNLSFDNDFDNKASSYIHSLLFSNISNNKNIVVTSNAFEPFNPYPALDIIKYSSMIIVDRDPRDAFISYIGNKNLSFKQLQKEVDQYINLHKTYHIAHRYYLKKDNRILFINFEDIVYNFDSMKNKIINFTGLNSAIHSNPRKYFNPEISKNNIGLWEEYPHKKIIEKIETELKDYLYQ